MKSVKILLFAVLVFMSVNVFAQTTKTEKIKVYGNCNICKKNIETASKTAGASGAEWNKTSKWLTVTYNPSKVTNEGIQKSIAAAGYDTEKYKGDDKAYNSLDECCQYDRKDSVMTKKQ